MRKVIDAIYEKLMFVEQKIENMPKKIPETIVFILYSICHFLMGIVHEPWFDEAQAWNIARDGSLYEILFVAPHYEGHPALWHLILSPFAKMGAPYEITLLCISYLFIGIAVYLIIFKSPFNRTIRLILPFTYFLFYQYGVVARPYCVLFMSMCILAAIYKEKDKKSVRFVLTLWLLCTTSAYGIAFAGGISLSWLIDIFGEHQGKLNRLLKDKRILLLSVLLVYVIWLGTRLIPKNAVGIEMINSVNSIFIQVAYCLFAIPAEIFLTNAFDEYEFVKIFNFNPIELIIACVLGIVILLFVVYFAKKKGTIKLFFIPYCFFALFGSFVYMSNHHVGVVMALFIFWYWISKEKNQIINKLSDEHMMIKRLAGILLFFCMLIPFVWNVGAIVADITYSGGYGRDVAAFISNNNFEEKTLLCPWQENINKDGEVTDYSLKYVNALVNIAPYGVTNNCINWKESMFVEFHRMKEEGENETILKHIKECGYPEMIIGSPDLKLIYGDDISQDDYTEVFRFYSGTLWKGGYSGGSQGLYIRRIK